MPCACSPHVIRRGASCAAPLTQPSSTAFNHCLRAPQPYAARQIHCDVQFRATRCRTARLPILSGEFGHRPMRSGDMFLIGAKVAISAESEGQFFAANGAHAPTLL